METTRTLHDVVVERENPYFQDIKSDLKKESFPANYHKISVEFIIEVQTTQHTKNSML